MRGAIAAHFPRPGHRLADQLAAGTDQQAVARAQNAADILGRELDDILARDRDPGTRLRPTAGQINEARSRADAARQRFDDIVRLERPATVAALKALRAVMDLPAPNPPDDGADRLTRHRQQLTERLTGALAATATTTAAGPRPARDLPRHHARPTTVKRGMR